MHFSALVAHFLAGALLANGVPHFVSGVLGRRFRTPFVRVHGGEVSSAGLNVFWGWLNFVVAIALFLCVGPFSAADSSDLVAAGVGVLLAGLALARIFASE
ncbi:MAG: hypothetical protein KGI75_10770 [Rhizobiaceae bacterium]|nr:hypothetical protein [Rhizobiaceae bacterium]